MSDYYAVISQLRSCKCSLIKRIRQLRPCICLGYLHYWKPISACKLLLQVIHSRHSFI